MEINDISINNKKSSKQKDNISNWSKISNKYILLQIFEHLNKKIYLKTIKYNKKIQNILEISLNDFKKYSEIEIEIIPNENRTEKKGPFININNNEEESYYHIYYNDNKKETKIKNKNIITRNVEKIKVIIDYRVKSIEGLFLNCNCIKSINFIKFNRSNINNMNYMFSGCSKLKEINLFNFNTNNVNNMSYMFCRCESLEELNLSNFNTENVIQMTQMFLYCSSLKEINLSNFNTNNVTCMSRMFHGCNSLIKLNISNFNTDKVNNI